MKYTEYSVERQREPAMCQALFATETLYPQIQ